MKRGGKVCTFFIFHFSRFPHRTAGCIFIFSWIQCVGSTGNMRVFGEGLKTIAPDIGERSPGRSCARTVWNVQFYVPFTPLPQPRTKQSYIRCSRYLSHPALHAASRKPPNTVLFTRMGRGGWGVSGALKGGGHAYINTHTHTHNTHTHTQPYTSYVDGMNHSFSHPARIGGACCWYPP